MNLRVNDIRGHHIYQKPTSTSIKMSTTKQYIKGDLLGLSPTAHSRNGTPITKTTAFGRSHSSQPGVRCRNKTKKNRQPHKIGTHEAIEIHNYRNNSNEKEGGLPPNRVWYRQKQETEFYWTLSDALFYVLLTTALQWFGIESPPTYK